MNRITFMVVAILIPMALLSFNHGNLPWQPGGQNQFPKSTHWRLSEELKTYSDGSLWKDVYHYNAADPADIDSLVKWNYYDGQWFSGDVYKFIYDTNHEYIMRIDRGWTGGYDVDSKWHFVYDSQHRLTQAWKEVINWDTMAYELVSRTHFIYGTGTQFSMVKWNAGDLRSYFQKSLFDFDAQGRVVTKTDQVSADSTLWTQRSQYQYAYHPHDSTSGQDVISNITYMLPQVCYLFEGYLWWDNQLENMVLTGMLSTTTVLWWSDVEWLPSEKFSFTYDANYNLLENLDQISDGSGGWNNSYRNVYTYDANNCSLTKTDENWMWPGWAETVHSNFTWQQYTGIQDEVTPAVNNLQVSAYPNPFSSNVMIATSAKTVEAAKVEIYNVKGQLVREFGTPKSNSVVWNGLDNSGQTVAAGIYFIKASNSLETNTIKVLRLK